VNASPLWLRRKCSASTQSRNFGNSNAFPGGDPPSFRSRVRAEGDGCRISAPGSELPNAAAPLEGQHPPGRDRASSSESLHRRPCRNLARQGCRRCQGAKHAPDRSFRNTAASPSYATCLHSAQWNEVRTLMHDLEKSLPRMRFPITAQRTVQYCTLDCAIEDRRSQRGRRGDLPECTRPPRRCPRSSGGSSDTWSARI